MGMDNWTEVCTNCAQSFSPTNIKVGYVTCPIFHQDDDTMVKEKDMINSVGSVLTSIYQLQQNNKFNLVSDAAACCFRCSSVLNRLYQYYVEFNQYRQPESLLSDVITSNNNNNQKNCVTIIDGPVTSKEAAAGQNRIIDQERKIQNDSSVPILHNYDSPTYNYDDDDYDDGSSSHDIQNSSVVDITQQVLDVPLPQSSLQFNLDPRVILDRLTSEELRRAGVLDNRNSTTTTMEKKKTKSKKYQSSSGKVSRKWKSNSHSPQPIPVEVQLIDGKEEMDDNEGQKMFGDDYPQGGDDGGDPKLKSNENVEDSNSLDCISNVSPMSDDQSLLDSSSSESADEDFLPKKTLSCPICDKTFLGLQGLDKHLRVQHGQNPFKCAPCDLSFASRLELRIHIRNHQKSEESLTCSECGKRLSCPARLKSHLKTHQNTPDRFCCLICSEQFSGPRQLKQHLNASHPPPSTPQFECSECPKSFSKEKYLKIHMKRHASGQVLSYSCHICGKSFGGGKARLRLHLESHAGVRDHLCPHCGRKFRLEHLLRSHILIHTNEKPFECQICHKFFRQESGLRHHAEEHVEGKPHLCSECGMSFQRRRNLLRHQRVHSDHRPYACQVEGCGRAFKSLGNLRKHADVHDEERRMYKRTGRGLARKKSE